MALQVVLVAGLTTLGCSNVLALDAFEDAEATSTTSSASATASSSGSGGAGGAAASATSSDASTGTTGGGGAASTSTGAGGDGGSGGAGPSDCAGAVASGMYNACVDPSGRFYWGLATIYASGSPLPDAQVAAGEWSVSLWALGDPLNGTTLTLVLESPGVARMDLPAGLPEGQCRTQADCQDAGSCAPPGSVACGGATGCNLNGEPCEADATCGGTPDAPQFCAQDPCCGMGVCQPGCLDDLECGLARSCAADGRCVAAACDEQAPCPDNFACMAGSCARKPCDGDAACAGVCVLQQCQESFGTCELPAP